MLENYFVSKRVSNNSLHPHLNILNCTTHDGAKHRLRGALFPFLLNMKIATSDTSTARFTRLK
jgi:hypothetical protein